MDTGKVYKQYALGVVQGKIVASKAIRMAAQRTIDWDKREDIYFDYADVDKKIGIIQKLKHSTGKSAGKPFILLPYQSWIISEIFGWKYKDTGLRITRKALLMLSRKQGKTALAAAIGIIHSVADNELGAEVDIVANSRQQAKIAYGMVSDYAESVDPASKIFKRYRDNIQIPKLKSKIQVLASEAMTLDGYNSSLTIIDEFHAQKTWDLYNVLVSSQGMRSQPLMLTISTAGFLLSGYPLYEMRQNCLDILEGNKQDDSQFSAIYELDQDDDYRDESVWLKAAPSLGQTVLPDYLRDQVVAAKNQVSLETGILTKNFNVFCSSKDTWIHPDVISGCMEKIELEDFRDEDCYMGVDLSAVSDLTSTAVMFPPNPDRSVYPDKYVFYTWSYLPDSNLEDNTNRELYKLWKKQGFLQITSGNVVDYDYILKDQLRLYNDTYLMGIYYDAWNSTQWSINATTEGLPLFPYSQALGNFNKPTKTFEMLIKQGKVVISYSPLVKWCFGNVEIKRDFNDNSKPVKAAGDYTKKIDPVIAIIQALGGYLDKSMGGISDGQVLSTSQ